MFGIEMEPAVNIVLLAMAGFLFLGACVLVFWFLRRVVHRRQWFLLGGAFFIWAILAVMFIYQQTINVQSRPLDLVLGILMFIAAGFACLGLYVFRN